MSSSPLPQSSVTLRLLSSSLCSRPPPASIKSLTRRVSYDQGSVTVVFKRWFEFCGGTKLRYPHFTSIYPPFYLNFTSFQPLFNLTFISIKPLLSRQSRTTVWKPWFTYPRYELTQLIFFCLRFRRFHLRCGNRKQIIPYLNFRMGGGKRK